MWKSFTRDLAIQLHPDMVKKGHIDGKTVEEKVIRATGVYTYVYVIIVIISLLLIGGMYVLIFFVIRAIEKGEDDESLEISRY